MRIEVYLFPHPQAQAVTEKDFAFGNSRIGAFRPDRHCGAFYRRTVKKFDNEAAVFRQRGTREERKDSLSICGLHAERICDVTLSYSLPVSLLMPFPRLIDAFPAAAVGP